MGNATSIRKCGRGNWSRWVSLECLLASAAIAGTIGTSQAAETSGGLEEIVVTAQRRVENSQDVPIATTVLTGDMLTDRGVNSIVELQYAAPGFTVADYGSANVLNIRGIGRSAVDIELPSGVVLYRDGFPTFPGYFQNEPYYDIASVEILRGPQGTFVGKSAAGGAIFIRTAAPDLSGFKAKLEGELGNFQQYGGTAVVNMPLSDTFALRVAAHHEQRDEILMDSLGGDYTGNPGTPDLSSVRIGALWKPSDALTAQLRVDGSDLDFGGNITSSYGFSLYNPVNNVNFQYRDRSWRAVGDVKYTLANDLVLSSVTGFQRVHTNNNFDRNGSQPAYNTFDSQGIFKLYSQEFDLISPDDKGPFSYVLGVFAQRTESNIFDWRRKGFNITLVQGPYPTIGLDTPYIKKEDEFSGFADVKYHLTEQWEAELGLRYSNYKLSNDTNVVLGDSQSPPTITIFVGKQERKDDDVDGKLTLTYKPTVDQNIYGLVARAHINGGFNIIGGAAFEPEEVFDYELGWKATWAGGSVRTQLGAYYQTLSDFQAQFASEDLPSQNILKNAEGKSKVYGVEASLQARVGAVGFDMAAAYLHSELGTYPRVVNPFDPPVPPQTTPNFVSVSGGRSPFSPEFTLNVGGSYEFEMSSAFTIVPRIDVSYVSDANGSLIENPATLLSSRTLVNAGIRFDMTKWYADAWITNATDKRYVAGIQDIGNIWYPGAPRQYGVRVGVDF